MKKPKLTGIIAATVTPMTKDYGIDRGALRSYLAWLVGEGVHGLAVNVDTGEGPHLTHREKLDVLETAVEVVAGRVPVVAGLSGGGTAAVTAAAREYRAAGADALLVFPSSVFRGSPLPAELPVSYHRAIGEGADVPLVLFDLQEDLGGVEYPVDVLIEIAELPHVTAIKEATFDARKFRETVAALRASGTDITILTGNDNFIYESFLLGAEGALIGFGTVLPDLQVEMYEAFRAGDLVRSAALAARFQPVADRIFAPPVRDYRARLKAALKKDGILPTAVVRPPLRPVDDAPF